MIEKIQIIHEDFQEALKIMPYESVGRVFMALIAFASDEDPEPILGEDTTARVKFYDMKSQVIRNENYRISKAHAGSEGGKAKAEKAKQSVAERSTSKHNVAELSTTKQSVAPYPNPNPYPNPTPIKKTYGECENVLLSDDEYEKIKAKGLANLIDELSLYIEGSGKKYKSHYAVIRQWGNRREKEKQEKKESIAPLSGAGAKNMFNRYPQRTDYDFKALEDKLVKN